MAATREADGAPVTMTLLAAAVQAFKWSLLGEAASRLVAPIVFVVLARLLLPDDFGVVAAATVAVSFFQVFWDSGLTRALVQRDQEDAVVVDTIFWINLALSGLVMGAMWMSAPMVAAFFNDARIADVLRVLCVVAPLTATSALLTALMQRRFDFKRLFWVRLVTTAGPGLVSIPLALGHWGHWALVAGVLLGQVLQVIVLWWVVDWRPSWRLDRRQAADLLRFGKWTMLSGLLGWLYGWLDSIMVGYFMGSSDMGLYRTGNTFVILVFGLIFSPLLPVLYSLFSRAQNDLPRLREALLTVAQAIAVVSLPIGLGLALLGDDVGTVIFGAQWVGVGAVVGLTGLSHAMGWIAGANGELYRATGRPHIETLTMAVMLAAYIPIYWWVAQRGLGQFLWARVGLSALALVGHVVVCWRVLGISPLRWLRACGWATACALLAMVMVHAMPLSSLSPMWRVALSAGLGLLVYVVLIAVAERDFMKRLISILKTRPEPVLNQLGGG